MPPSDVVQVLSLGRRSGVLEASKAKVCFQDGNVVGAWTKELKGEAAFHAWIRVREGGFAFEPVALQVPEDCRIATPTMALLMESMRQLDERGRPG
jgi:hypothetical protein